MPPIRSAKDAADSWRANMEPFAKSAKLVSPAITNGPAGVPWLQEFMTECSGCTVNYINLVRCAYPATAKLITAALVLRARLRRSQVLLLWQVPLDDRFAFQAPRLGHRVRGDGHGRGRAFDFLSDRHPVDGGAACVRVA
jgi:hypothetical protein